MAGDVIIMIVNIQQMLVKMNSLEYLVARGARDGALLAVL
jgi:hypothetical protein